MKSTTVIAFLSMGSLTIAGVLLARSWSRHRQEGYIEKWSGVVVPAGATDKEVIEDDSLVHPAWVAMHFASEPRHLAALKASLGLRGGHYEEASRLLGCDIHRFSRPHDKIETSHRLSFGVVHAGDVYATVLLDEDISTVWVCVRYPD